MAGTWLIPSVMATLVGASVLCLVFYFLYRSEKQPFMGIWALAWAFYSLRFAFMLVLVGVGPSPWLMLGNQSSALVAAMLLARGTYFFTQRPFSHWWSACGALILAWLAAGIAAGWNFTLTTAPLYLFQAVIYISAGALLLRSGGFRNAGGRLAGWSLIIWGLHKADYPLLRPLAWAAPLGYLLGALLELSVALGMLLAYFHKVREGMALEQERYQALATHYPDGAVAMFDRNLRMTLVSGQGLEQVGLDPAEMLGKTAGEVFGPDLGAALDQGARRALAGEAFNSELPFRDRVYDVHFLPLTDGQGRVAGGMAITHDVTRRKVTEDELRSGLESTREAQREVNALLAAARAILEQKEFEPTAQAILEGCRDLLGAGNGCICLVDPDNPGEELFVAGVDQESCPLNPDMPPEVRRLWAQALKSGRVVLDGSLKDVPPGKTAPGRAGPRGVLLAPLVVRGRPWGLLGLADRPGGFQARHAALAEAFAELASVALDNSRDRQALEWSEERFRQLAENVREVFWIRDLASGRTVFASPLYEEVYHRSRQDLYRDPEDFLQAVHPDDRRRVSRARQEQEAGVPTSLDYRVVWPDGQVRWVWARTFPISDEQGRIIRVAGVAEDITSRKQTEMTLQRERDRAQQYLDLVEVLMVGLDRDGRITLLNRKGCEILGVSEREVLGRKWVSEFIPPENRQAMSRLLSQLFSKGATGADRVENEVVTREGLRRLVTWHNAVLRDERGDVSGVLAAGHDITQQRRDQEAALRLMTAIEQADESVTITDRQGVILYVNPAAEKISGYTGERMLGETPRLFSSGRHDKAFYQDLWSTVLAGRTWRGQITNQRADGSLYDLETSISPVRDSMGAVTHFVAVAKDITNERVLERQLRQAQKMEAIGTLAGGIAHDFNNILAAIFGYAELAADSVEMGDLPGGELEQILKACDRARSLVGQILTFSRQTEQERRPIELGLLVKEALKLLRASLPATIEIVQNISAEHGRVLADPSQMHQVVMNLCTNAAQAMHPDGGRLEVTLTALHLEDETAPQLGSLAPGPYVKLAVGDTGVGMSHQTMERIFDPFFTTRQRGGGTGLGLSMVHGIITGHGGAIRVYSEPGQGSVFHIYLPLADDQGQTQAAPREAAPTGRESLLLVDDEELLVDIGCQMLARLGYRVEGKYGSLEALEAFRAQPEKYDLLITDLTMPGMTGLELSREVLKIRPGMPILLCTGFSEIITPAQAKDMGIKEFVMKPMVKLEMAKAVRRALDD